MNGFVGTVYEPGEVNDLDIFDLPDFVVDSTEANLEKRRKADDEMVARIQEKEIKRRYHLNKKDEFPGSDVPQLEDPKGFRVYTGLVEAWAPVMHRFIEEPDLPISFDFPELLTEEVKPMNGFVGTIYEPGEVNDLDMFNLPDFVVDSTDANLEKRRKADEDMVARIQ